MASTRCAPTLPASAFCSATTARNCLGRTSHEKAAQYSPPASEQTDASGLANPAAVATEVEWLALRGFRVEFQSGVSQEGVDELGPVLDPLEPVLHHRDQLVDTVHDEVAQAALDMRPHLLGRVEVRSVGGKPDHVQPVPCRD